VYVKELHSGKECRYDRHQIEGVADLSKLPKWVVDKLHTKTEPTNTHKPPSLIKKTSLQEQLNNAKEKVRKNTARKTESKANNKNNDNPKKRTNMEVD
jgi:hypothetical protein